MPQPYQNGKSPAPHNPGGAFFVAPHPHPVANPTDGPSDALVPESAAQSLPTPPQRPTPTVFLPDVANPGWDGFLYTIARTQIAGFSLFNWLLAPLIAATLVCLLRGAWSSAAALGLAAFLFRTYLWLRMRRDFAHFTATPTRQQPVDAPRAILDPRGKLPIHVTGCLDVGGKVQRFTFLPGFYRTFATREHALLCLCRGGRRALLASWPETETGIWYAFFHPQAIRKVERGTLHFGSLRSDALAVEIDAVPTRGRIRRRAIETLFLAADPPTLDRIWRDLTADAPPHTISTPSHHATAPIEQATHPQAPQHRS